jgi:hypothetical protein
MPAALSPMTSAELEHQRQISKLVEMGGLRRIMSELKTYEQVSLV